MLKALIVATAILAAWLAAGLTRTPATPLTARVVASSFVNTRGTVRQPGTRGPVIQL
jgi:hypothetical protein